jgi:hypothetical protein
MYISSVLYSSVLKPEQRNGQHFLFAQKNCSLSRLKVEIAYQSVAHCCNTNVTWGEGVIGQSPLRAISPALLTHMSDSASHSNIPRCTCLCPRVFEDEDSEMHLILTRHAACHEIDT